MLWKVNNTDVYLFGGIHILKPDTNPYRDQLDKIYTSVEQVVFEVNLKELYDHNKSQKYKIEDLPNNPWIKKAKNRLGKLGIGSQAYESASICRVANVIFSTILDRKGYKHSNGVDNAYFDMAQNDKKILLYLETINENIRFFDHTRIGEQIKYLKSLLEKKDSGVEEFEKLLAAWSENNLSALRGLYAELCELCPELYHGLIDCRNNAWVPKLHKIITSGVPTLIIVGALHCIGKDTSLQSLLNNKHGHEFKMIADECLLETSS